MRESDREGPDVLEANGKRSYADLKRGWL